MVKKSRIGCDFLIQFVFLAGPAHVVANSPQLGYTVDYLTDTLYSVDLQTGVYNSILTVPGAIDFIDIAFSNSTTLYALGFNDRQLYSIDLTNQTYDLVSAAPIGSDSELVYAVGIADPQTAYVVGYQSGTIYRVNLDTGVSSSLVSLSGTPGLTNIAVLNSTTAYVVGYNDNNLYRINLSNGTYSLVTPVSVGSPGTPALEGIALASDATAYVVGNMDANIYRVDLGTGNSFLVTGMPVGDPSPLISLAESDGIGYTVNNLGSEVYKINLTDGNSLTLAAILGTNLSGMAIPPSVNSPIESTQIDLTGLKWNDLHLARYLNEWAPENTIASFSDLTNGLEQALKSAAPTRNAHATYASQSGYLALSRVIRAHERQKRFHPRAKEAILSQRQLPGPDQLLASASNQIPAKRTQCKAACPYTVWVGPFGSYTEVHAERQTPAFNMGLGGIAVAFDYNGVDRNMVGLGSAYAYTHVHEKSGAGHANLNQGFTFLYATICPREWYVDLAFSGGYYQGDQVRHISFPGVQETASSRPRGWQVAPHLEIGYNKLDRGRCNAPWFGVEPFLLLDWVANWEKKRNEAGAGNFNMGQKSRFCSLLHGETGFRFHEMTAGNWGALVFREKLAYSYQKAFKTGTLSAFLVGSPGTFTVETLSQAQNLGIAELSLLYLGISRTSPYIDLRYEGQFGSAYRLHQATIEVGKNF